MTRGAAAAISAFALVLGAWCGQALASADVQAPCPELASHTETSLHEILGDDETESPAIRNIESTAKTDEDSEKEDLTILNAELPDIATALPGVSVSDLPRFRRQMYRTDI